MIACVGIGDFSTISSFNHLASLAPRFLQSSSLLPQFSSPLVSCSPPSFCLNDFESDPSAIAVQSVQSSITKSSATS